MIIDHLAPASRRWVVGGALVLLGWLLTPQPIAVYDGIGVPDEPYRFVTAPTGTRPTAPPTVGEAKTPVARGVGTNGLIIATLEQTPQFSLYLPPGSLAADGGPIEVRATPQAPADNPPGSRLGGNVYLVSFTAPQGTVHLTSKAALASLYLRAINGDEGWTMQYRASPSSPWTFEQTARNGTDSFVARFVGAGQYALAEPVSKPTKTSSSTSITPFLVIGGIAALVVLVVIIRLRAAPE